MSSSIFSRCSQGYAERRRAYRWREFYERLQPFAVPNVCRSGTVTSSPLSRFLAALTEEPVQAQRTLFLDDLPSRPITNEKQTGGLVDRTNNTWVVFAIDGTREAARGRALPQTDELPPSCSMVG